jgi:hypothetical protein
MFFEPRAELFSSFFFLRLPIQCHQQGNESKSNSFNTAGFGAPQTLLVNPVKEFHQDSDKTVRGSLARRFP